jgi:hypothetical protein
LVLIFGFLKTVGRPDAGTSLAAGLLVVTLVVLEDQMLVVLTVLEESARETDIWKWPQLWVTVVVRVNCTLKKLSHGQ